MLDRLEDLRDRARKEIESVSEAEELETLRVRLLGKKGELTLALKAIGSLPPEERPLFGKKVNEIKAEIDSRLEKRKDALASRRQLPGQAGVDLTLPGRTGFAGSFHPVTQVMEGICGIFNRMGFSIATGPEVELDYYNFEALNIPADHPARDMQDTFYVDNAVLLRTHTSPIQVRTMERLKPPVRIIAPGKVYRCDSDITHTPMFHQVEGLMVDEDVSFADLKGILTVFIHEFFSPSTAVRFRPSFFPFTEPSAEVDIQCVMCKGDGCRVCSQTGWLEVLGAGMVHPQVFRHVGYDPEHWTGFAFGLGVERIAMLTYGIDDIRLFYENDLRFLRMF